MAPSRLGSRALVGRWGAACLASASALCTSGIASAQDPEPVDIEVRATEPGGRLEPIWAYFGYDEANYTTTSEGRALLGTLAAAHRTPVHVRTHFLFNTGDGTPKLKWGSTNVYTQDDEGNPVYDFALLDGIMQATIDEGTLPLFELGFMPEALSVQPQPYENSNTYRVDGGCFYPPTDYAAWASLVTTWATHVKERYPESAPNWEWELWNEPDIPYWQGTTEEYFRLYDYTQAALHAVLPDASLGGPAVANPGEFLSDFLEHCATGINAVTGQVGTRLDMVSFHAKGGVAFVDDHPQMDLGNQLRLHRRGFETVAGSAFSRTPVVITEADPDGCAACPAANARQNAYRNSPAYGAYEVAMMKRTMDLAAELNVNLRGVLTWAFTFPGTDYFAGYRALASNGINLPVLNAFKLLGSLGGVRLPVTSSGARPSSELIERGVREAPDVDALATLDGDRIQILVWHYHDDLVDAPSVPVTVSVALPSGYASAASLTHLRVDSSHGDAHTVWESQGSPVSPTPAQLDALRVAMNTLSFEPVRRVEVRNDRIDLTLELPRFGVSLLTLEPSEPRDASSAASSESGCQCGLHHRSASPKVLLALALAASLLRRRARRAAGVALC